MLEPLKLARQLWDAKRSARRIALFLESSLKFGRGTDGRLDLRMQADDFVLAYIYGVITAFVRSAGSTGQEELSFAAQEVFERLFSHQGRLITELCGVRLNQKERDFVEAVELGASETSQALKSNGQIIPQGLLDHVLANYRRD